jgi:hypothetical protein
MIVCGFGLGTRILPVGFEIGCASELVAALHSRVIDGGMYNRFVVFNMIQSYVVLHRSRTERSAAGCVPRNHNTNLCAERQKLCFAFGLWDPDMELCTLDRLVVPLFEAIYTRYSKTWSS